MMNTFKKGLLGLWIIIALSISLMALSVRADTTSTMTVLQTFGEDSNNSMDYKIMVKAPSGNRYFVWYRYSLGINIGSSVIITLDSYGDWLTISNPQNGAEQNISKVIKVN
jgi:hypothetical protein